MAKKLLVVLIFVLIFDFFLFPAPVMASEYESTQNNNIFLDVNELEYQNNLAKLEEITEYKDDFINILPDTNLWPVKRYSYHEITAYTSETYQCDGDPCTTANGFNLCENDTEDSVAVNWLPFGAKIRIPDIFGNRVFIVRDRMNSRYSDMVDVWFKNKEEAKKFGIKITKVEILE